MKVLDLDMDFFLSDACPLAPLGERPSENCAQPYTDEQVIAFLEEQCGLSREHPVPGLIFDTHDKALDFWRTRMREGVLDAPFDVVHVDTHSDLAFGPPGTDFVLKAVLTRNPKSREALEAYRAGKKLDEANYLLFALAFRWISSLENVRNPSSLPDIPKEILVPGKADSIQLSSFTAALSLGINGKEPVIPFNVYEDYNGFKADEKYDFMSVAISPRYSPKEADVLLPVFEEYMTLV